MIPLSRSRAMIYFADGRWKVATGGDSEVSRGSWRTRWGAVRAAKRAGYVPMRRLRKQQERKEANG